MRILGMVLMLLLVSCGIGERVEEKQNENTLEELVAPDEMSEVNAPRYLAVITDPQGNTHTTTSNSDYSSLSDQEIVQREISNMNVVSVTSDDEDSSSESFFYRSRRNYPVYRRHVNASSYYNVFYRPFRNYWFNQYQVVRYMIRNAYRCWPSQPVPPTNPIPNPIPKPNPVPEPMPKPNPVPAPRGWYY